MEVTWKIGYCPWGIYKTVGMNEYDSLELELNLPLKQEQGIYFMNLIAMKVAGGKKYSSGDRDTEIFNQPFYILETHSAFDNKKVLRVIFIDPNLRYPWDKDCFPQYKNQLNDSEIICMKKLLHKLKNND